MRYCPLLCTHLSFLLFLILYSRDLVTGASSCPSDCGGTLIPYPFGIGKGCYLNEWFEVQCNNSISGKPVPYLPEINKEVVSIDLPTPLDRNISYPYGSLRIKTEINSMGCSSSSSIYATMSGTVWNFTGSPFTIGHSNVLVAVGCNNKATLLNLEPRLVGCIASCGPRIKGDGLRCNGYKCCQTERIRSQEDSAVGNEVQVIGISIENFQENQTRSCKAAFLTDEFSKYPEEKLTDPLWFHNQVYATVQLRWVIPNMTLSFIKSLECDPGDEEIIKNRLPDKSHMTCQCNRIFKQFQMGESNESISGTCQCSRGYRGNPYLLEECTG